MKSLFITQSPRIILMSLILFCFPTFASDLFTIKNESKEQLVILDATVEAIADEAEKEITE